jgi:hypothetical protein
MTACVVLPPQPEFDLSGRAPDAASAAQTQTPAGGATTPSAPLNTTPTTNTSSPAKSSKRFGLGPFKLVVPVVARGASGSFADAEVEVEAGRLAMMDEPGVSPAGSAGGGGEKASSIGANAANGSSNNTTNGSPAGAAGTAAAAAGSGGAATAAAATAAAGGGAGAGAATGGAFAAVSAAADGDSDEARDGVAPLRRTKSILKTASSTASSNGPGSRTLSWRDEGDAGLELTLIREFERSESEAGSGDGDDDDDDKPGGRLAAAPACCVVS